MSYNKLVYKIGRHYSQALEQVEGDAFPTFSGQLSDFLDDTDLANLPELVGEHVIGYTSQGVRHYLRAYFDEGSYQLTGTPMSSDSYGFSSSTHQSQD